MSRVIRSVRSSWLPLPPADSADSPIPTNANTYKLAQIAIEAAERLQQNNINRTIRAGRMASAPVAESARPIRLPSPNNFIINLPVN